MTTQLNRPPNRLDQPLDGRLKRPLSEPARSTLVAKRVFDLVVGVVLLVIFAPVLVILAVAGVVDSGWPVLFRQVRLGHRGRSVTLHKLRTIRPDREPGAVDPDREWTVPRDRTTAYGRWLRETHLDELPQLVDVVFGRMSLVGPRPERPYFAARFAGDIDGYPDRLLVPAGLTGWAQVHGLCGDTCVTERVRFDRCYVENVSLAMDLRILWRTAGILLMSLLSTGGRNEGSARDHRTGRRRGRTSAALSAAEFSARVRGVDAL